VTADVARDIIESEFVVADITPSNPNVYYEVGFAHAMGKPVIMVADEAQVAKLPFDVAATRVVFYENTIAGKRNFEENFRRSLAAIEQKRTLPANARGLTQR
jgi:nucleoside 2-deoxyribosyltransferase